MKRRNNGKIKTSTIQLNFNQLLIKSMKKDKLFKTMSNA